MKPSPSSALALAFLCLLQSAHAGATLDRVRKKNVMVEAVSESYPPFSFLNDDNRMDGFDVDVAREIARRVGVALKVETPSWELLSAGPWRGRWDICVCSMTPDRQRAQVLDFVVPYYVSPAVLVTTAANTGPKTPADFANRRIGVEQASSYERYLHHELVMDAPGAKPLTYPLGQAVAVSYGNEDLAFQDLALGAGKRLDAVLSNLATARTRMAKMPGKFRIVGEPIYAEPNWIAIDKAGDPQWKALIARTVHDMKADGTLAKISLKWVGSDVTP